MNMFLFPLDHLIPIENLGEVNRIHNSLSPAFHLQPKSGGDVSLSIIKLNGWIAAPGNMLFEDSAILSNLETLIKSSQEPAYIILSSWDENDLGYVCEVPPTNDAVNEVARIIHPFCSVLFTGSLKSEWIIVALENEFFAVAGKPQFITQLFGCSIDEAFLNFRDFYETNFALQYRFLKAFDMQLERYNNAQVGDEFLLFELI
ncbi:hypothetical protein H6F43_07075 [Leptolyngbya sp. FACHB-36]|uniref:hypothetical protein n=1 Tax=Leptolyngbya sp. FACHB-36 TaxID=2692808 RepID=UPI001681006A|nr:hypothetical protein [Leptolyngbya sp. FACHB-36]MBD2019949.1 hypothetical protein [Leptolyngbya sp. FACHB-36]